MPTELGSDYSKCASFSSAFLLADSLSAQTFVQRYIRKLQTAQASFRIISLDQYNKKRFKNVNKRNFKHKYSTRKKTAGKDGKIVQVRKNLKIDVKLKTLSLSLC